MVFPLSAGKITIFLSMRLCCLFPSSYIAFRRLWFSKDDGDLIHLGFILLIQLHIRICLFVLISMTPLGRKDISSAIFWFTVYF